MISLGSNAVAAFQTLIAAENGEMTSPGVIVSISGDTLSSKIAQEMIAITKAIKRKQLPINGVNRWGWMRLSQTVRRNMLSKL